MGSREEIIMATTMRQRSGRPAAEKIGDCVIVHLDETLARRRWCPDHLLHLQERPADADDAVAMLRWCLAWMLDCERVETIARRGRVDAGRIMAFLEAPARQAGDVMTFAEAGRLLRYLGQRIADRTSCVEADDNRRIAEPYIEIAGLHVGRAIRDARRAQRMHRAAVPSSPQLR
jgi:hypothetical protein